MRTKITRRDFLTAGGVTALAIGGRALWTELGGKIPLRDANLQGPAHGHRLRTRDFPSPSEFLERKYVIAGGGVAGLSAAYHLHRAGEKDFALFELERSTGGNSIYGENKVSRYPWGAHYLPLPALENRPLLEFLETTGVIRGWNKGLPVYDELHACHDPQERCFDGSDWAPGLLPSSLTEGDSAEVARFGKQMDGFHSARGADGRPGFTIPVHNCSRDQKFLALDSMSMAGFLEREGYKSNVLRTYIDYCMRDDFGATVTEVSAWAGIHYFAARGGKSSNLDEHALLTWPEGNGWLTDRLAQPVTRNIHSNHTVFNIGKDGTVDVFDHNKQVSQRVKAKRVIFSAPRYTAFHIVEGYSDQEIKSHFQYSTWFIANVTLEHLPPSVQSAPLSWDNIRFGGEMLGYVVATHQNIKRFPGPTVVSVYWPITHMPNARAWARDRSSEDWREDVIQELERMHPGIRTSVREIETKIWGHAMVKPTTGFYTRPEFHRAQKDFGPVTFAHSDASGISIFENAFESGRLAAERVRARA